jgi:hypothetical protein
VTEVLRLPDGYGETKFTTILDGFTGHERMAIQGFGVSDRFLHQSTHDVEDVRRARNFLDAWLTKMEEQR